MFSRTQEGMEPKPCKNIHLFHDTISFGPFHPYPPLDLPMQHPRVSPKVMVGTIPAAAESQLQPVSLMAAYSSVKHTPPPAIHLPSQRMRDTNLPAPTHPRWLPAWWEPSPSPIRAPPLPPTTPADKSTLYVRAPSPQWAAMLEPGTDPLQTTDGAGQPISLALSGPLHPVLARPQLPVVDDGNNGSPSHAEEAHGPGSLLAPGGPRLPVLAW